VLEPPPPTIAPKLPAADKFALLMNALCPAVVAAGRAENTTTALLNVLAEITLAPVMFPVIASELRIVRE
jgi:hypothetical protein